MSTTDWGDAFLYHIFPLGALGGPRTNPGGDPVSRILDLAGWIEPATRVGANVLLLGPLWESGSHGYDTVDYRSLDRRLGTNADLSATLRLWKARGFRILFDGVFNHCGRGFAPFQDLLTKGRDSRYADWFEGVVFDQPNALGDPLSYVGWAGHLSLVKYNLRNQDVKAFLFDLVRTWISEFDLDGLRLDAADVMDPDFLRELSQACQALKPGFWLLGEVVHGDYSRWAPGAGLDSVTNYELFKGLWSSLNDDNFFELAWTLNRQFGPQGLYRGQRFQTFGDNHDVDRIASVIKDPALLYVHAILSIGVPGIPSVYYGSEAGQPGRRTPQSDVALRPSLRPEEVDSLPHQPLRDLWRRLIEIRRSRPELTGGEYEQAFVTHQQFAFWRSMSAGRLNALIVVNSANSTAAWSVQLPSDAPREDWVDLLNPGDRFRPTEAHLSGNLPPRWGRILIPMK